MISFRHRRYRQAGIHQKRSFLVFLFGLLTAGCGDSQGEISGKVFYKGQPLTAPGAIVTFIDANGGVCSCSVAADGGYAISKIPVGQVKIAVIVLPQRRTDRIKQSEQEAVRAGILKIPPEERERLTQSCPPRGLAIAIPAWYADPEKSGLVHTVSGGKQNYDIQLR